MTYNRSRKKRKPPVDDVTFEKELYELLTRYNVATVKMTFTKNTTNGQVLQVSNLDWNLKA